MLAVLLFGMYYDNVLKVHNPNFFFTNYSGSLQIFLRII